MGLESGAKIVLEQCLSIKPGERVLIVTDTKKEPIGRALFSKAVELGSEAIMLTMLPRSRHGEEPPGPVAEAMKRADVVICPTEYSLTHTQARKEACEAGARIATMPGITEGMFSEGAMTADYRELAELTVKVAELLTKAETAVIENGGKRLTLSLKGRKALASTGLIHRPGEFGNLPTGEAYIAPVEGTANGELIVDGSVAGIGILRSPLRIEVKGGIAVGIFGDSAAELERILGGGGEARNVAELGIGTKRKARLIGIALEDEKIYGSIHIALGDNSTFGGTVRAGVHIDCILLRPTLYLDGEKVVEGGELRV
ncbi:MAG: aminopeptidase [Candidatus Bathyarchaeia archaeon]